MERLCWDRCFRSEQTWTSCIVAVSEQLLLEDKGPPCAAHQNPKSASVQLLLPAQQTAGTSPGRRPNPDPSTAWNKLLPIF